LLAGQHEQQKHPWLSVSIAQQQLLLVCYQQYSCSKASMKTNKQTKTKTKQNKTKKQPTIQPKPHQGVV